MSQLFITDPRAVVEITDEGFNVLTVGLQGPVGADGPPGDPGPPGESAGRWTGPYDHATSYAVSEAVGYGGNAYICTVESTGHLPSDTGYWDLMAAKGDTGADGADGAQGQQGDQGIPGEPGAEGADGAQGPPGIQGPAGADGADGAQGPAGADGDAADIAAETHVATSKTTPVDADEIPLVDSAVTFGLKKLTWANVKATAKTYFDTLYSALGHAHSGTYEPANSNLQTHVASTANPHAVTYSQVGAAASGHDHAATYAPIAKGVTNGDSHDHNGGDGAQIAYSGLSGLPTLGTAAAKNIPASGNASATEVVYGSDTRLTNARTPSAHTTGSHSDWPAAVSTTEVGYLDGVTSAIQAQLDGKSGTSHDHAAIYAPIAKGVTNGDSHDHSGGDGAQIAYSGLSGLPTLGTAAAKNIPATGDASATEVVYGTDTRLSDARTPTTHSHTATDINSGAAANGTVLTANGAAGATWASVSAGDVVGPASSTDNAIVRFDGTTGKLLQSQSNTWVGDDYSINIDNVTGTNYERFTAGWGSNLLSLSTSKGGSGTNRDMEFNVGGSKLHIKTDGTIYLDAAGQTVGNARGAGSVDLQAQRNTAAKVASGACNLVGGIQNTVSGSYSLVGGSSNTVSNSYVFAAGYNCTAAAMFGVAVGSYGHSANKCQVAIGGFLEESRLGMSQANIQPILANTTDATATVMSTTYTTTDRVVIPAKRACTVFGLITAYSDSTDGYKVASWEIRAVIERNASNATRIVGTPTITQLAADADAVSGSWAVTSVTADDTNEALAITVTGQASTNIRWQGSLFYGQVGYA